MKLAVLGSKTFNDYSLLDKYLTSIHNKEKIGCVISDGAKGIGKLSEIWAKNNNILTKVFYPNRDKYGSKAEFLRNKDIIIESDKIISFWDGMSNGTKSSIELAKRKKKKCLVVNF